MSTSRASWCRVRGNGQKDGMDIVLTVNVEFCYHAIGDSERQIPVLLSGHPAISELCPEGVALPVLHIGYEAAVP